MDWKIGVHIGTDELTPTLCAVTGFNVFGAPKVALKISNEYWCYIKLTAYNTLDVQAFLKEANAWVKAQNNQSEASKKEEKKG